jgi:hypothetical protein
MEDSNKSKIRIKYGDIELEYEGSEKFIKTEIFNYMNNLITPKGNTEIKGALINPKLNKHLLHNNNLNISISTYASKLKCKSGSELVIAAALSLHLGKAKETFNREEILKEMKLATAYYKESYNNNLSSSLKTLVKAGKLLSLSGDAYSLQADTISALGEKVAN